MLKGLEGDTVAYERMLLTISTMIRGYLIKSLGFQHRTEEAVEDLIQEVLLSIHRKKHLYRADMPIVPWIFAIARYRLIDHVRSEKRRPVLDEWEEDLDVPSAHRVELSTERVFEVEELLEPLNPRQKQIFLLAKADGVPLDEIAKKLGMSLTAVKVTVHRALQSIRKNIKK